MLDNNAQYDVKLTPKGQIAAAILEAEAKGKRRHLHAIAREIKQKWTKPYFGAVPYIDAMLTMHSADDDYGADNGKSIVLYFLANAATWRGDDARRIKAELKALVK